MIKSTVNSQKALVSIVRILPLVVILLFSTFIVPQKAKAADNLEFVTSSSYVSGTSFTVVIKAKLGSGSSSFAPGNMLVKFSLTPSVGALTYSSVTMGSSFSNTSNYTVGTPSYSGNNFSVQISDVHSGTGTTLTGSEIDLITIVFTHSQTSGSANLTWASVNTDFKLYGTSNSVNNFTGNNLSNQPLPVTLLSFTGVSQGLVNVLTWKTATEINNDKFVIKRSNGTGEFVEIGTVQGSGNSNQIKEYSFIDNNPLPGSNIYKLIQVDFNGISESFKPIIIKSNNEGVKFTVNPNPSNGIFSIRIDEGFQNNPLEITDPTGRVIYKSTTSNVDVDISNLSPGIYTINSYDNLPTKITIW